MNNRRAMQTSTTPRALAVCTLTVLLLTAGCADKGPDEQASASWSSYTETMAADEEAEAVQDAEQAVRDWMHISSQCLADPPSADLSCFDEVSYGDQLTTDRAALEYARDNHVRYVGELVYLRTEGVDYVDLSVGADKEVHLSVCWSIENYDIIMSDGTSAIPPDEPRRARDIFVVLKHTNEWQLAEIQDDPEGAEC